MSTDMKTNLPCSANILRKQFSNGVTVLVHENPWSSTAAVCGSLFAGSCLETADKFGLASFVSAALTMGTQSRDFMQISEYLESIGASLSFGRGPHTIHFKGNCLCEDLTDLLRLLKEILDEPAFPERYVEIIRQRALRGFTLDSDDPDDSAWERFKNLLWMGDHPYGRREYGSKEIIRNITRNDLVEFHRRFFGPKKLILAIAGGFRGQEIMDRCEDIFGNWEKSQEDPDEDALFPEPYKHETCVLGHVKIIGSRETTLTIGTFGPAADDPDVMSARLGNYILGEDNLLSRVGYTVREKHGLAYSVYSSVDSLKKSGSWSVSASVDPADLEKAGALIFDELRRFILEPVSQKELEDAKACYLGGVPLGFAANADKAFGMHGLAYYQLDLNHFLRIHELVDAVTPETVLETARKWIDPGKMIIVTAGPNDDFKDCSCWWHK